jgi:hypothetical protein
MMIFNALVNTKVALSLYYLLESILLNKTNKDKRVSTFASSAYLRRFLFLFFIIVRLYQPTNKWSRAMIDEKHLLW